MCGEDRETMHCHDVGLKNISGKTREALKRTLRRQNYGVDEERIQFSIGLSLFFIPNDLVAQVSPPSPLSFSPHRSWKNPDLRDEDRPRRSPREGEAGFYLEEVVFGGVVDAVVDRGYSTDGLRILAIHYRKIALYTADIDPTCGVFDLFGTVAVKDEAVKAFFESQPLALPFDDQVLETAVDSDDPAQRGRRLDFRMKLGRRRDVGPFDEDDELVSDYYDDSGDD
ncbi:hypothetical protein BT96DRAFT_932319 [Gymnopus androsaceus JB14]|uniref:Uncharacterized protein n=1 Tax=Gymnopus androsaceus JB14 TaxID=1447944 RepID=A0A6A4IKK0_9AGAR|nr:hypothetical protein BT96DRAFT_932319 [Gymnopus androsaceus JB14]